MNRRLVIILLVGLFGGTWNTHAQSDSIRTGIQSIEALYNSGAYLGAEVEARRMLERADINDSSRAEIHRLIAFSLIAQGKQELAKERFALVLHLFPAYTLDPVYTSPKILIIFNETKQHFLSSQKPTKPMVDITAAIEPMTRTYRTILFPGWEQLHAGRTTTGTLFLGAGIATLGAGITFEFLRISARQDYLSATDPAEFNSKYETYNRYYKAEVASFISFAIVYLASEIDIFTSYQQTPIAIRTEYSKFRGSTLSLAIKF
jgi:hypothetical protein